MKSLILFWVMFSYNAFAGASFTYDNTWYVIYDEGDKTNQWRTKDDHLVKVPSSNCVLSPTVHNYYSQVDTDVFSRAVACFKPDVEDTFKCTFDNNWKDEDGEKDDTATTCTKKYEGFTLILKIRRYPNGKYEFYKQMKKAVESKKAI